MPTIYEQIEEAEKTLNLEPQGDDDDQNDDGSIQGESGDGTIRRQTRSINGTRSREGDSEGEETGGRGRSSDETSRSESGTSSEDAGASQRHSSESRGEREETSDGSKRAQTDASASQEDGEDRSVRGQRGSDLLDEPTKPLTNADWARQRRELRELKAKLAQLEAAKPNDKNPSTLNTSAEKPSAEIPSAAEKVVEPDKNVNYQAWLEWKLAQTDNTIQEQRALLKEAQEWKTEQTKQAETQAVINNAVGEFQTIEQSYQKSNPDYLNAMEFARNEYSRALKITNPQMTQKQIDAKIDYDILAFASQKSQLGLNPAEELYDLAMERFGYQKAETKIQEEDVPVRKQAEKPNLRTVSNNRRRSASPLTGGGQGGSIPLTKEIAANMNMAEFSALTPDELSALEAM